VIGPDKPRATEDPPSVPGGPGGAGLASALAATRARATRPPERRRRSRSRWVAIGAAAVALVLIAALFVGAYEGVRFVSTPKTNGTSPSSGPVPTTFYGALTPANLAARALYWDWPSNDEPPLVFAEGLAAPVSLGAMANATRLGVTNCTPTILSETVPTLPAYSGSTTTGEAQGWLFAFSTVGGTLLVLAVVNGTATIVASTTSPGACYGGPGSFNAVVVDSSVAAATAEATRLSMAFLHGASANSTAVSTELLLVPPGYVSLSPPVPMWIVTDTTCALYDPGGGGGSALTTVVNAVTGALYSQASAPVHC
jgi:hypothetical protein